MNAEDVKLRREMSSKFHFPNGFQHFLPSLLMIFIQQLFRKVKPQKRARSGQRNTKMSFARAENHRTTTTKQSARGWRR
jgi:hypothetical protein